MDRTSPIWDITLLAEPNTTLPSTSLPRSILDSSQTNRSAAGNNSTLLSMLPGLQKPTTTAFSDSLAHMRMPASTSIATSVATTLRHKPPIPQAWLQPGTSTTFSGSLQGPSILSQAERIGAASQEHGPLSGIAPPPPKVSHSTVSICSLCLNSRQREG